MPRRKPDQKISSINVRIKKSMRRGMEAAARELEETGLSSVARLAIKEFLDRRQARIHPE